MVDKTGPIEAGWYPDPLCESDYRRHDGAEWTQNTRKAVSANTLLTVGEWLRVVAIVGGVIGVAAGAYLASYLIDGERPHRGLGAAVAIGAFVQALMLWTIGSIARFLGEAALGTRLPPPSNETRQSGGTT